MKAGRRFFRFNVVGAIGIAVQLAVLEALLRLDVNYLLATVLAVEAAILHNFVWHERYTWRDRAGVSRWEWMARLVRFHLANGVVSLAGNALLMRLLVGEAHLPAVIANGMAIAACGLVNFVLGDRVVYRRCAG
jgi:dolichol-phosphate mannosyltransferase